MARPASCARSALSLTTSSTRSPERWLGAIWLFSKPEQRNLVQNLAFEWNGVRQNHIERGQPIGGNDQ